jgi:hypothetical protein
MRGGSFGNRPPSKPGRGGEVSQPLLDLQFGRRLSGPGRPLPLVEQILAAPNRLDHVTSRLTVPDHG